MTAEQPDDAELIEQMRARIRSGALAAASPDVDVDVDVAFVYVGDEELGDTVEVVCEGCGLRGRLPVDEAPPQGAMVFCIDCLGRLG